MKIEMQPIGYIKSPYKTLDNIPKQSVLSQDKSAIIEILPEYKEGIKGIKENTYGVILFYFHKSTGKVSLKQISHKTNKVRGVFSTRSPRRPNGIGMSVVQFTNVKENKLEFRGVDMINGTPILDIKPYNAKLNPK